MLPPVLKKGTLIVSVTVTVVAAVVVTVTATVAQTCRWAVFVQRSEQDKFLINVSTFEKCGVLDGHALRILDALKKRKTRPAAPAITGSGAADFMRHRKKRLDKARS